MPLTAAQEADAEARLLSLLRWRAQSLVKQIDSRHVAAHLARRTTTSHAHIPPRSLSALSAGLPCPLSLPAFPPASVLCVLSSCASLCVSDWGYVYCQDRLSRPCIVLRAANICPAQGAPGGPPGEAYPTDWRQCVLYLIEEALQGSRNSAEEQLTLLIDGAGLHLEAVPFQAVLSLIALLSACYSQYLGRSSFALSDCRHSLTLGSPFLYLSSPFSLGMTASFPSPLPSPYLDDLLLKRPQRPSVSPASTSPSVFACIHSCCLSVYLALIGMAIVVSCGVDAALFWKTLEPFLSAETRSKIFFLPHQTSEAAAFLLQFFEWKVLPAWLIQRLSPTMHMPYKGASGAPLT
ncbi:hypothetical protein cyc_06101 [Cyclospora cayetanensis]|uniref:CRAL-TRIO domain-containing protein n=1 Tax=Cyclospora cayetanensis TaxID=88456 RepID=A0A1D3D664_9EIME|nr:hypothetical protein cyc_06101 [Cyclospora cayetanensis]